MIFLRHHRWSFVDGVDTVPAVEDVHSGIIQSDGMFRPVEIPPVAWLWVLKGAVRFARHIVPIC